MFKRTLKIFGNVFSVVLFLFGAFIYMYPFINGCLVNRNSEEVLDTFHRLQSVVSQQETESTDNFADLYEDMQKYNENIYTNGQKNLKDAWSYEQSAFDLSAYGISSAVTAELRIPKMEVDLPIYLGATWDNMGKGAAQLGQTSMPIGGNNTNCVIAGHRGSSGGRFFLDIELLEIGDCVYIDNLWETLTYQVRRIEIISPDDIDKILIEENKDMVTLITCHPYPYNYQRYAVYCERCPNDGVSQAGTAATAYETSETDITVQTLIPADNDGGSQLFIILENILYILVPIALILLAVYLFFRSRK